ncbi:hypothetical protein BD560DRAFT_396922 [Blakeslea trispora]|nr:hypothetical protein BD560DRAFT_396922 [Blakeslea trispora]
MAEPSATALTTYSYVILAIFIVVVILVIRPVKIRLHRRIKIYLTIATVPPLGVLILLICRAINFDVVARGFLGTAGVQPWSVMILFYALVYEKQHNKYADTKVNASTRLISVFHWT